MKVWLSEHRSRDPIIYFEEKLDQALEEIEWDRCLKDIPQSCEVSENRYYVDDWADIRLVEIR